MDIGVIITSYNEEDYISEAIDSVLAQTHEPDEIIIIDAGSNDNSKNIIEMYEKENQHITSYFLTDEYNIPEMRNFGIKKSQTDYITFLDGDDRFRPQKLACELEAIQSTPDAEVSFSNVAYINEKGNITGKWSVKGNPPSGTVLLETIMRDWPGGSLYRDELISADLVDNIGLYDEELPIYEDWDFKIRTAASTKVSYCPQTLTEYRRHSGGISSQSNQALYRDTTKRILNNNRKIIETLDTKNEKEAKEFIKAKYLKHHSFYLAESGEQRQALKSYYEYLSRRPDSIMDLKMHLRVFLPNNTYNQLCRLYSLIKNII